MTAVEWFVSQLKAKKWEDWNDIIEQAKEMEKQQHEETFEAGYGDLYTSFEQYYSETYKKDKI